MFTVQKLEIQNLRNFEYALLDLSSKRLVLLGGNNSGKTGALLLLNWVFNICDEFLLEDRRTISDQEKILLIPARNTKKKARRITLHLRFQDGRTARKYRAGGHPDADVQLRLSYRVTPRQRIIARLGPARKGEPVKSHPKAIELFKLLRSKIDFHLIPSFRDAGSGRFADVFKQSVHAPIADRLTHKTVGGTREEYRKVKAWLKRLEKITETSTDALVSTMKQFLPPGLAKDLVISFDADHEKTAEWMAKNTKLRISTGDHDSLMVDQTSVGSGLQSLLYAAIIQESLKGEKKKIFLAFEEPEAFLHPSAQRIVARQMLDLEGVNKIIITTHSPIIVEEAQYRDLCVVRDGRFYSGPRVDERTNSLFSSLMTGHGIEMMFGASILLVEGEGDRQFFEKLRRRLAKFHGRGLADQLYVAPVGGNNRFSPWLQLLMSFSAGSDPMYSWLVVADNDASTAVRKGCEDANIPIEAGLMKHFHKVSSVDPIDTVNWRAAAEKLNFEAKKENNRIRLLPGDLEYSALQNIDWQYLSLLRRQIFGENSPYLTKEAFIKKLGSKGIDGKKGNNLRKEPWIRGFIGETIPVQMLSPSISDVLKTWLSPVCNSQATANRIVNRFLIPEAR